MKLDNSSKDHIKLAVYDVHMKSNSEERDLRWYITQLCNSLEREFPGKKIFSSEETRFNPSSIIIPGVCVIDVKNYSRTSLGWTDSEKWININAERLFLPGVVVNFALGRNPTIEWYYLDVHNKAVKESPTEEEIILTKPITEEEKKKKLLTKVAVGAGAATAGISALTLGLRARRRNRRNK